MLHTILEGVWQTHYVRVHGIWCYRFKADMITGEQTVQWPACKEQDKVPKVQKTVHCIIWH